MGIMVGISGSFYPVLKEDSGQFSMLGRPVIALQKKKGSEFAIGGHYSAFRSRLYISMENNELKIVKAKNWAGSENPNNKVYRYKLVQGAKFIELP